MTRVRIPGIHGCKIRPFTRGSADRLLGVQIIKRPVTSAVVWAMPGSKRRRFFLKASKGWPLIVVYCKTLYNITVPVIVVVPIVFCFQIAHRTNKTT